MKSKLTKKLIGILLAAMLLFAASALVIGCSDDEQATAEKLTYSVTVLSPDETPRAGVTVSWQQNGANKSSAVTGEDGKATASLPAGTYTIALDVDEGLSYTSVSVGSSLRNVTLTLSYAQLTYRATVIDKDGSPAAGVTVSWMQGTSLAGSAQTDAEGVATCELNYGEYTVTVAGLPDGNIYNGDAPTATGANSSVRFELISGVTKSYSVTVRSVGGLLFNRFRLLVYKGETPVTSGWTDETGVYTVTLAPDNYTVRAAEVQDGYTAPNVTLTASMDNAIMELSSAIITSEPAANTRYVMGDIFHDYTFTTPYEVNGSRITLSIAELLKTKDAILINNWGTRCTYCVQEMPAMEEAYQAYKDKIEIIAVSNYQGGDSDSLITAHYNRYGYTFPMMRDTNGFASKFGLTAWPSTVVIDRYGAIARIESGAILDSEVWGRLIEKYIGDDYVQTFTPGDDVSDSITTEVAKPDIILPADHYDVMAELLNNTDTFPADSSVSYYGETEYEYAWPYIMNTVETVSPDEKVVYAGGTGKANSMSVLYATVNIGAGKVFTFDYYADTEEDEDVFSVLWDGKIIRQISGNSHGWQTCRLYADLAAGSHTLAFVYIKDSSKDEGADNVFLRDVRFTELSEITEPTDMLRAAAYGVPEEGATRFPHYASVSLGSDGYYHVNKAQLENSAMAGNDDSPMLFANLLSATNWLGYSVRDLVYAVDEVSGEYAFDLTFTINGVTKDYRDDFIDYLSVANNSDIAGFMPIDEELHDLLVEFTKRISGTSSHADEWLELCYFYSHYGSGDPVGNPIIGLTEKTAIEVSVGTATAELTRYSYPFPINIYTFTPQTDGVYRIQSLIPEDISDVYAAQAWLYDDLSSADDPLVYCGDSNMTRDGVNEHNVDIYRYMTAGHKYYIALAYQMAQAGTFDFSIELVGNSVTVIAPASYQYYWQILDENGNFTDEVELAGAIEYVKDDDGYYHAINPDGSVGSYIYLDVKYPQNVVGEVSITALVDMFVKDPADFTDLDYKAFDFRYRIAYYTQTLEDGGYAIDYDPKIDLTTVDEKYRDYTDAMKAVIASAPTSGDEEGLVRVTDEIVNMLTLYIETRNNMLMDTIGEHALENEWLRFCWYYRTYDIDNV